MTKIIFLDFDGPLTTALSVFETGSNFSFDRATLKRLNYVCEASGAKIVCSSTRTTPYNQSWQAYTFGLLAEAGLDVKHIHKDWSCHYDSKRIREEHIQQWLKQHPDVTHYVAIDDYDDDINPEHLVLVDFNNGIVMENWKAIAKILDFDLVNAFKISRSARKHDADQLTLEM